jgi:transposase
MGCKVISAAYVKPKTPHWSAQCRVYGALCRDFSLLDALTESVARHSYYYIYDVPATGFGVPQSDDRKRSKIRALAEDGALNPAPEKIRDPKFHESGFFDPRDIVQVKYEMLRRASVEKASVTDVANEYGVSRPTFYQAKADFEDEGVAGLVPRKRGPRGPHKIQSEVLAFLEARISPGEPMRARELAKLVQKELGLDVHPRTIERAIGAKKTSGRSG